MGDVNIHTLADNDGTFVPDPDLRAEVTYRRSQTGRSPLQRSLHAYHQNVLARVDGKQAGKNGVAHRTGPPAPAVPQRV
ncbi:hypothetical protein GCM10010121_099090 [Streptomyces brasiliensis]|uniref:Uncharacterized protein n=1 Tax=Streptomyces brasiliensis TaxID=1954 RepID=A0A917UPN9_9ACTN|nr:hypothetical protein GCM10010121_099090 [Streptomyces brasiliensis]